MYEKERMRKYDRRSDEKEGKLEGSEIEESEETDKTESVESDELNEFQLEMLKMTNQKLKLVKRSRGLWNDATAISC